MIIKETPQLDFSDVLFVPQKSSMIRREDVVVLRDFTFKHSSQKFSGVPIIAANMDTIGTFEMASSLDHFNICTALHKHYDSESLINHYYHLSKPNWHFYSLGLAESNMKKFKAVYPHIKHALSGVVLDVANGYTEKFVDFVKSFRDNYPDLVIMAGNVVTGEMTQELIQAGADIVKVGIGPGSVCTTRKMTGVGFPQFSAIIECANAAHGLDGHICSDGGCVTPGDVSKAFGAGADFVMLGGMLSGHDECSGDIVDEYGNIISDIDKYDITDGPLFKQFYGMSSTTAMNKYHGGVASYRASEGKSVMVSYKGSVKNTVQEILGGVRSTCTYIGARKIKEMSKRAVFIKVNRQLNTVYGNE